MKKFILVGVAAIGALGAFGDALTNWVDSAVSPGSGTGTKEDPFGSLYQAVATLSISGGRDFDTVVLKKGTYKMSDFMPADVNYMQITGRAGSAGCATIMGETGDPNDVIIDCEGRYQFLKAGSFVISVRGITIRNACNMSENGSKLTSSAIYHSFNKMGAVIADCIFTNCLCVSSAANDTYAGGAIWMCSGTIERCRFFECAASNATGAVWGGGTAGRDGTQTVRNCLFERCWTYSGASAVPSGAGEIGATGGAGSWYYNGTISLSNCVYISCTSICATAAHAYGGAIDTGSSAAVRNCFVTNCFSSGKSGGINSGTQSGCTVVACRAATVSASRSIGSNCLFANNEATGNSTCTGTDCLGCVFRDNKVGGSYAAFSSDVPLTGVTTVISNSVFARNVAGSIGVLNFTGGGSSWDGMHNGNFLLVDCIFKGNGVGRWGAIPTSMTNNDPAHGLTVRNCLFRDLTGYYPFVFVNQSDNQKNYVDFENCTFLRTVDYNQPIISYNSAGYKFTHLKNCLFYNKQTGKMLPTELATMGNVTNCVFSNNKGVNLAPEYGNRVLSLANMGLDADYRPLKGSPLVDACTNDFAVAWAPEKATRKRGPWDMGDGTWTEKPYATLLLFGKSYPVGVVITRNNAKPRLYGDAMDIGCFEYWTAPGLMLLVK